MIKIKNLEKQYNSQSTQIKIPSLSLPKGKRIGVVGETGSGKSTLLKLIAGLEQADGGQIYFEGERVLGAQEQLVPGHSAIAYLTQEAELPLFVKVENCLKRPFGMTQNTANRLFKACDIKHLLQSDTRSLSGGERQRVALAKLLLKSPKLLLLDEPFANLDPHHKSAIKRVIELIEIEANVNLILVAHDPQDILPWADLVWVMKAGKIIQKGTPYTLYNQPKNEYVAGLLGTYSLIEPNKWNVADAHDFSVINGKLLIRPTNFKLVNKNNHGLHGKVLKTHFHGSYDEVIVNVNDNLITLNTQVGKCTIGELVKVALV